MEELPRHQCIIYEGSPARYLARLTQQIRGRLHCNFRCLYFNSLPMIAGLRSALFAAGVDVVHEIKSGRLVLSSEGPADGVFDGDQMLQSLEVAVEEALEDGFAGLWATGDMSLEIGNEKDFMKLLKYEWGLEELFRRQPALHGVCQYHLDTLPADIAYQGLIAHKTIFVNETLSCLNPYYVPPQSFSGEMPPVAELKGILARFEQEKLGE